MIDIYSGKVWRNIIFFQISLFLNFTDSMSIPIPTLISQSLINCLFNVIVSGCGGLGLASSQTPTQMHLLPLLNRRGRENRRRNLVGSENNREIAYQCMSFE